MQHVESFDGLFKCELAVVLTDFSFVGIFAIIIIIFIFFLPILLSNFW